MDYFGFSYHVTEVDSYTKKSIVNFTNAKDLPILVLRDKQKKMQYNLTNTPAIISALESLRNSEYSKFDSIIGKYLPILMEKKLHYKLNPFKYHVTNSDLK